MAHGLPNPPPSKVQHMPSQRPGASDRRGSRARGSGTHGMPPPPPPETMAMGAQGSAVRARDARIRGLRFEPRFWGADQDLRVTVSVTRGPDGMRGKGVPSHAPTPSPSPEGMAMGATRGTPRGGGASRASASGGPRGCGEGPRGPLRRGVSQTEALRTRRWRVSDHRPQGLGGGGAVRSAHIR